MKNKGILSLVASMVIFGTIGIFRRYIPLPSGMIAFSRGIIGAVFLLVLLWAVKKPFSFKNIEKNILPLFVSGGIMGFNWILLFEAYNYTSVAAATLCYYMAPIFVILVSPLFFGEKLTGRKVACVFGALCGMVLVSGIFKAGFKGAGEVKGLALGLGAAVLYAAVVIMNKKTSGVPAFEKTVIQLASAAAVVLPYSIFAEEFSSESITPVSLGLLLLVGILHTGIAYALYFGSINIVPAQTAAIFSYIDPVSAIILSAIILEEKMGAAEIAGAVLILGSAIISETKKAKD